MVIDHEDRGRGSTFSSHGFLFFREIPACPVAFPHEICLHHHEWHEFIVTRSLEPGVLHELTVDGASFSFGDWGLVSIPPFSPHRIIVHGLLCQYLVGVDIIEMLRLFSQSPVGPELKKITDSWKKLPTLIDLKAAWNFPGLRENITASFQNYPGNGTLGGLDSLAFLRDWERILCQVNPGLRNPVPDPGISDSTIILRAISFLENHFAEDVGADDCAQDIGISRSSLSHTFKQQCGMSIPQWMIGIRIRHAKSLLQDSDLDTLSIAMECGFNDNSWFFRQFRKAEGVTPTHWRKLHKKQ